ncbi:hypothetical protein Tco_0718335, partial [Tanacetum coccineum]
MWGYELTLSSDNPNIADKAITGRHVKNFAFDNIMCRFRVLAIIITNNRTQLINEPFKSWVEGDQNKATPRRRRMGRGTTECIMGPQDNAENNQWVNPIQSGIWYQSSYTGKDRLNMNLLEKHKEIAMIREARRKQQVEKHYNQMVRNKQFRTEEFVLQKNEVSKAKNTGKLRPKWEGPHEVIEAYDTYAYKLRTMDGAEARIRRIFLDGYDIIMENVIPLDHVDDLPVVEPNQPDVVPVIPKPVLVDEDEDPEEEDFEEEEEPREEEEEDMDIDDKEDENEPELTSPYEEEDPLNPPPPASDSELKDVIKVEDTVEPDDETVPASVHEVGESSTTTFLRVDHDRLLLGFIRRDIDCLFWLDCFSF